MYLKLALRNVFRNKRRTLLTLLGIVLGAVGLILFRGYAEWSFWGLRESTIHSQLGHLQVFNKGFNETRNAKPGEYNITNYAEIQKIIEQTPHVEFTLVRLGFQGLISNGRNSVTFLGQGVEPDKEDSLSRGEFVTLKEGKVFTPDDRESALLGQGVAEILDARIGDYLTLMTTTYEGGINAVDVKVSGIFSTGIKEYDEHALTVPLKVVQNVLFSESVEKILVVLDKTENTDIVAAELQDRFQKAGLNLEIKKWLDLAQYYRGVVSIFNAIFGFIQIIVAGIVVFSIINTMVMSIYERTREIGTLRALGTTRRGILTMFLNEAFVLGLIGAGLGIVLGFIAAKLINVAQIQMPPPPGYTTGYDLGIWLNPGILIYVFLVSIITAVIGGIYPAWKATRLEVVQALRHT